MTAKRILLAAAAVCAMVACFSSCKKDDKPKGETVTASVKIDPCINDEFKNTCCINYSCIISDENGTQKSEGVLTSVKEITGIVCPCTITLDYTYAFLKGQVDADKKYSLTYGPVYTFKTTKSTRTIGSEMYATVKGSEISDWIDLMNELDYKEVYTIDKNGQITKAE